MIVHWIVGMWHWVRRFTSHLWNTAWSPLLEVHVSVGIDRIDRKLTEGHEIHQEKSFVSLVFENMSTLNFFDNNRTNGTDRGKQITERPSLRLFLATSFLNAKSQIKEKGSYHLDVGLEMEPSSMVWFIGAAVLGTLFIVGIFVWKAKDMKAYCTKKRKFVFLGFEHLHWWNDWLRFRSSDVTDVELSM